MATTISRRTRRIGLLPSTYVEKKDNKGNAITVRVHNFDQNLTAEEKELQRQGIREQHYLRKDTAKPNPAAAKHRRSKSRRKAAEKKAA